MTQYFSVNPKLDCPHSDNIDLAKIEQKFMDIITNSSSTCIECKSQTENWVCLLCQECFCSRYVAGHMKEHFENVQHGLCFSLSDASFWCYECDSYVYDRSKLRSLAAYFSRLKYPDINQSETGNNKLFSYAEVDENEKEDEDHALDNDDNNKVTTSDTKIDDAISNAFQSISISTPIFTYEQLIIGLKTKAYSQICFLTGAGISVAAGTPDFRTPGTGLYSKVHALGLPYPEAVFSIEYLRKKPQAFYHVAKDFLTCQAKPVLAHKFIKKIQDNEMLSMNFTQNIDGLELDAGISLKKLVQAHGHMRTAHCIDCGKEYPIDNFFSHVNNGTILLCNQCNHEPQKGLIKPDIVFFGENLPMSFFSNMDMIAQADLVFVMGTSLKVFPFANLVELIPHHVPIVLINREDPGLASMASRNPGENILLLTGDIEERVKSIADDCQWELN